MTLLSRFKEFVGISPPQRETQPSGPLLFLNAWNNADSAQEREKLEHTLKSAVPGMINKGQYEDLVAYLEAFKTKPELMALFTAPQTASIASGILSRADADPMKAEFSLFIRLCAATDEDTEKKRALTQIINEQINLKVQKLRGDDLRCLSNVSSQAAHRLQYDGQGIELHPVPLSTGAATLMFLYNDFSVQPRGEHPLSLRALAQDNELTRSVEFLLDSLRVSPDHPLQTRTRAAQALHAITEEKARVRLDHDPLANTP